LIHSCEEYMQPQEYCKHIPYKRVGWITTGHQMHTCLRSFETVVSLNWAKYIY
jgi:hypothetical protein